MILLTSKPHDVFDRRPMTTNKAVTHENRLLPALRCTTKTFNGKRSRWEKTETNFEPKQWRNKRIGKLYQTCFFTFKIIKIFCVELMNAKQTKRIDIFGPIKSNAMMFILSWNVHHGFICLGECVCAIISTGARACIRISKLSEANINASAAHIYTYICMRCAYAATLVDAHSGMRSEMKRKSSMAI